MKRAISLIRKRKEYPWEQVNAGLCAAGYDITNTYDSTKVQPGDLLVTWNCYGSVRRFAEKHVSLGGIHACLENGYLDRVNHVAFGLNGYCGWHGHAWPAPDYGKLAVLPLDMKPWKKDGDYILVCGQRGGAYSELSMPLDWPDKVVSQLRELTDIPIIYRAHPGRRTVPKKAYPGLTIAPQDITLSEALLRARSVVVWTSNAATDAVVAGVPVVYCGPSLTVGPLAMKGIQNILSPVYPARKLWLARIAAAQCSKEELRNPITWEGLRDVA